MSILILVASCFIVAPLLAPFAGARAVTQFTGGADSIQMKFEGAGTNTTATLTLPKNATVLNATLDLTATPLTGSGNWAESSGSDFSKGSHFNTTNNTENLTLDLPKKVLNNQVTYNVGSDPVDVKIGDLDNDGKNDVAVSIIANPGAVKVLTQNNQGTLNAAVSYSSDYYSQGLAIGDLNGDGRKDVAASNLNIYYYYFDLFLPLAQCYGKDTVSVFTQNQAGTLNAKVNYGLGVINFSRYIAAGDINSDGKDELIVANLANSSIAGYKQNAAGSLVYVGNKTAGSGPFCVAIGDLSGDGKADVVVSNALDNTIGVFVQNVAGGLANMVTYATVGAGPRGVAIGDFNGDGRNDVVTCDMGDDLGQNGDQLSVFLQNNGGTLNAATSYSTGANTAPFIVDAGDINSDGLCDIVATLNGNTQGGTTIFALMQDDQGQLTSQTYTVGTGPAGIAVGDVSGDGRKDVVVVNGGNGNPAGTTISVLTQKDHYIGTFTSQAKTTSYNIISATATWNATLRSQNLYVNLSNDGGATWAKASNGTVVNFPSAGKTLMYRVDMDTGKIGITPVLNDISISYSMREYPSDIGISIGNTGNNDWSYPGELNTSAVQKVPDLSLKLMQALSAGTADGSGNVAVILAVSSATGGIITLSNVVVWYDRPGDAPVGLSPSQDSYVCTGTPTFQTTAFDYDGDTLMFCLEISRDNFATVKAYNQTQSQSGWSAPSYGSGAVASFTVPSGDKLNDGITYSWRVRVYDGSLWSAASQSKRFGVDTQAPSSSVQSLPDYTTTTEFSVNWSGSDPTPGSGLSPDAAYDVQVRDGASGTWTDWQKGVITVTARYTGTTGHTYYFRSGAKDKAGNLEPYLDGDGDTKTYVDATEPTGSIEDDGATTFDCKKLHAKFKFTDDTTIEKFEYSIGKAPGRADVQVAKETAETDVTVTLSLENGTTYYFNARAKNRAGLWSTAISSDGIKVVTAGPAVTCVYRDGAQKETDISIALTAKDPNNYEVTDGDLEYRKAPVKEGAPGDWGAWTDVGNDGGDTVSAKLTGEKGYAYQFRYRARNSQGTWGAFLEPNSINRIDAPPVAQAGGPSSGKTGKELSFFSEGSSDPDGDPLTFEWDFGDGKTGTGASAKHTYSKEGTFTVKLTVKDGLDSAEMTVSVQVTKDSTGPLPPIVPGPGGQGTAGGWWWWWILVIVLVVAVIGAVAAVRHRNKKKRALEATATTGTGATAAEPATPQPTYQPAPEPVPSVHSDASALSMGGYGAGAAGGAGAATGALAATTVNYAPPDGGSVRSRTSPTIPPGAEAPGLPAKSVSLPPAPPMDKERGEAEGALEQARAVTASAKDSGLDVAQAQKLLLMSSSFLQGEEYAKSVQYSKKATKVSTELMARRNAPGTGAAGTARPDDSTGAAPQESAPSEPSEAPAPSEPSDASASSAGPSGGEAPAGTKCPGCGEAVEPEWKLCPTCNTKLKESATEEPATGMKCPSCGEAIEPEWRLCPNCNTKLPGPEKPDSGKKCAGCGKKLNDGWKICPFCDTPSK